MSWWSILPGTVVLAVIVFAPGWLLLRLAGMRGLLPLASGPALSLAFFGLAGIMLDRAGLEWGWAPLSVLLIVAATVAFGAGRWIRYDGGQRRLRSDLAEPAGLWFSHFSGLGRAHYAGVTITIVVASLFMVIPIAQGMVEPGAIHQQYDAIFHMNGVQVIRETGNASTFGAMQPMFGGVGDTYYYPTVWHGIVALAPGFSSIAAGANASTFVFGVLVWLIGLAGFASVLFVGRRHRLLLIAMTIVFGVSFSIFPYFLLSLRAQWPFGSAIALIPGTFALIVAAFISSAGGMRLGSRARLSVTAVILAGAIGGVALTHGSALFSLGMIVVPFLASVAVRAARHRWASGARGRTLGAGFVCVAFVALTAFYLLNNPTIVGMLKRPRGNDANYLGTALRTITDSLQGGDLFGNWPLLLCVFLGFTILVWGVFKGRPDPLLWMAGAWLLVIGMVSLAAGPPILLRMITGLWYTETARVAAVYPMIAAPLGALGLVSLAKWAKHRTHLKASVPSLAMSFAIIAVLVTSGWHMDRKKQYFVETYVPGEIRWGTKASVEEIALLNRLPTTTESDALILGDPANGAAYSWSVAQRHVVLPHMGRTAMSRDQQVLRKRFNEVNDDPEICEVVNRLGVTHFYQDTAGPEDGARIDSWAYGLLERIDAGLRVVDRGGTATLYEITACD